MSLVSFAEGNVERSNRERFGELSRGGTHASCGS
jgi:hypothetical protein